MSWVVAHNEEKKIVVYLGGLKFKGTGFSYTRIKLEGSEEDEGADSNP